jgi:hypothetical protein
MEVEVAVGSTSAAVVVDDGVAAVDEAKGTLESVLDLGPVAYATFSMFCRRRS